MRSRALASLALLLAVDRLAAQQLTGVVLRDASRAPVSGVVLLAHSPVGDTVLARALSGAQGQFALPVRPGAFRVRALRIGYRPAELGTFTLAPDEIRFVLDPRIVEGLRRHLAAEHDRRRRSAAERAEQAEDRVQNP